MVRTDQIGYREDITKELAEEFGIPQSEIEEMVDLNLKYIKKSILEKPDVLIFHLPRLCKMRLNLRMAMSTVKRPPTRKTIPYQEKIKLLWKYKDEHFSGAKTLNFKESLFSRYYREINFLGRVKHISRNFYKVVEAVEIKAQEIVAKLRNEQTFNNNKSQTFR